MTPSITVADDLLSGDIGHPRPTFVSDTAEVMYFTKTTAPAEVICDVATGGRRFRGIWTSKYWSVYLLHAHPSTATVSGWEWEAQHPALLSVSMISISTPTDAHTAGASIHRWLLDAYSDAARERALLVGRLGRCLLRHRKGLLADGAMDWKTEPCSLTVTRDPVDTSLQFAHSRMAAAAFSFQIRRMPPDLWTFLGPSQWGIIGTANRTLDLPLVAASAHAELSWLRSVVTDCARGGLDVRPWILDAYPP